MKAVFKIAAALVLSSIFFTGCNAKEVGQDKKEGKVSVVVSFNPLKEFTEEIGKDKVNIKVIVPEGTEPHDFEPKAKDLKSINEGNIFVYNGLNMESWVDKTLQSIDSSKLIKVDSSKGIDPIKIGETYDPHVWLSIKNAQIQSKNIKDALQKADEKNKDFYEKNYEEFSKKLQELYNNYEPKFKELKNKDFVTGHEAFAYFCRDFGLEQKGVEDVFSSGEPGAKKIKELVEYCKKNNIKTIFMEELASPKVSETLSKEVGAKVEKIYTIESKEDNKNYLQSMESNLKKVYESLK